MIMAGRSLLGLAGLLLVAVTVAHANQPQHQTYFINEEFFKKLTFADYTRRQVSNNVTANFVFGGQYDFVLEQEDCILGSKLVTADTFNYSAGKTTVTLFNKGTTPTFRIMLKDIAVSLSMTTDFTVTCRFDAPFQVAPDANPSQLTISQQGSSSFSWTGDAEFEVPVVINSAHSVVAQNAKMMMGSASTNPARTRVAFTPKYAYNRNGVKEFLLDAYVNTWFRQQAANVSIQFASFLEAATAPVLTQIINGAIHNVNTYVPSMPLICGLSFSEKTRILRVDGCATDSLRPEIPGTDYPPSQFVFLNELVGSKPPSSQQKEEEKEKVGNSWHHMCRVSEVDNFQWPQGWVVTLSKAQYCEVDNPKTHNTFQLHFVNVTDATIPG